MSFSSRQGACRLLIGGLGADQLSALDAAAMTGGDQVFLQVAAFTRAVG
jgi:hypothetical protein